MRVIVFLAELSNSLSEGAAEVRQVEHRATLSATSDQRSALEVCSVLRKPPRLLSGDAGPPPQLWNSPFTLVRNGPTTRRGKRRRPIALNTAQRTATVELGSPRSRRSSTFRTLRDGRTPWNGGLLDPQYAREKITAFRLFSPKGGMTGDVPCANVGNKPGAECRPRRREGGVQPQLLLPPAPGASRRLRWANRTLAEGRPMSCSPWEERSSPGIGEYGDGVAATRAAISFLPSAG
jgi:hypothetical protein